MGIGFRFAREGAGVVAVTTLDGRGYAIARGDEETDAGDRAVAAAASGAGLRTFLRPRRPTATEEYSNYLEWHGVLGDGLGFTIGELVRPGSPRHVLPPLELWPAMVGTLAAAMQLRDMITGAGAKGLRVAAAFRPVGGTRASRHKMNAALDLDLLPGDQRFAHAYLNLAASLFRDVGVTMRMGIGSYHPAAVQSTRRVHLDVGTRSPTEVWQIAGANADGSVKYVKTPAIQRLLGEKHG